jgi:hypothetical protein
MKIRATKKVLNINRLLSNDDTLPLSENMPGEWYVDLFSFNQRGKLGMLFLHHPTHIAILTIGKSLTKSYDSLKIRLRNFLIRHDYNSLLDQFSIDSEPSILKTNDKGMLGHIRSVKENVEYHFADKRIDDDKLCTWIEDTTLDYLFKIKTKGNKYLSSKMLLEETLNICDR